MAGKQVTELDALPTFTDTSLLPVHNGAGLKKGTLSQLMDYIAKRFSNPNLLLNSNFKVDQRGRGTYTNNTTKPTYTLDRWISINTKVVYNIDGTATITSLATTDTSSRFKQILEHAVNDTCTLSCNITAVTGNAYLYNQANGKKIVKGLNTITLSYLKEASIELKQGASITIEWIKLEKGSKATAYVAPNYADELQRCMMYYNVVNTPLNGYFTTQMYIGCEALANMRTKPTIKCVGSFWVYYYGGNVKYKFSDFTIELSKYLEITLLSAPSGASQQNMTVIFDKDSYIELDAEVYAQGGIRRMYKVYVKLNEDKCITLIDSEIFLTNEEIQTMTEIDKGQGDKYVHAQSQYLEKGLIDEHGRYNYKYVEGKVVEVAEGDKPTIEEKAVPTEQQKINAQLMLQIAQLKAQLNGVKQYEL